MALTAKLDGIYACSKALFSTMEADFATFMNQPINMKLKLQATGQENGDLKSEKERLEVKLRHARSSFDYQMKKRTEAEEQLKIYEGQFSRIIELLQDPNIRLSSPDSRRSLAFLKGFKTKRNNSMLSPGHSYLSESVTSSCLSPSDMSLDVTEDYEVSILRDGKRWKRRRTASVENQIDTTADPTPPKKFRRSNSGNPMVVSGKESSLTLEVNKIPPLEKQFKKPPPAKDRRTPSKGHLKKLAQDEPVTIDDMEQDVEENMFDEEVTPEKVPLDVSGAEPSAPPLYPVLPSVDESPPPTYDEHTDSPLKMVGNLSPMALSPTPALSPVQLMSSGQPRTMSPSQQLSPIQLAMAPSPQPLSPVQLDYNTVHQRGHTFLTKTILKLEATSCAGCDKKLKFSKTVFKCRDCKLTCHDECKTKAPLPCVPTVPTPKKKHLDADLSSFCPHSIPRVPAIVVHCVTEIEKRGLNCVGIYRVPGNGRTVQEVKERLLCGRGNPNLNKVADINVLCGVLKDFFLKLKEPLLTFHMHEAFVKAAECETEEDGLADTLEAIARLPPANKDTLAYMIVHLQKVAAHDQANKMPVASLAKMLGPTLVGHATAKPDPNTAWGDPPKQHKVMRRLLTISPDYWNQYLSPMDNPEPPASPSPSTQSSPGGMRSPATPEPRPIPTNALLGSIHGTRTRSPHANRFGPSPAPLANWKRKVGNYFPPLN